MNIHQKIVFQIYNFSTSFMMTMQGNILQPTSDVQKPVFCISCQTMFIMRFFYHSFFLGLFQEKSVGGGTELENGGTTNTTLFFLWNSPYGYSRKKHPHPPNFN